MAGPGRVSHDVPSPWPSGGSELIVLGCHGGGRFIEVLQLFTKVLAPLDNRLSRCATPLRHAAPGLELTVTGSEGDALAVTDFFQHYLWEQAGYNGA